MSNFIYCQYKCLRKLVLMSQDKTEKILFYYLLLSYLQSIQKRTKKKIKVGKKRANVKKEGNCVKRFIKLQEVNDKSNFIFN